MTSLNRSRDLKQRYLYFISGEIIYFNDSCKKNEDTFKLAKNIDVGSILF
jgi:hypothetical protein